MPFPRTPPTSSQAAKPRVRNLGDLLILSCGLVAFLVLAFLYNPGIPGGPELAAAPPAAPPAAAASPSPAPADSATAAANGAQVAGAGPITPSPAPARHPALPPAAAPLRVVYPSAGLDVAVHPLEPSPAEIESQSIVPPISLDGYWLTNFGVPGAGSANTTYIMGHSWEGRDAPFNRLSSAAAPGDIFEVTTSSGKISYRVDSISTENKSSLKENPIWRVVPNRLVLISCYTEDLFGKNVVLVASPAPPAPGQ